MRYFSCILFFFSNIRSRELSDYELDDDETGDHETEGMNGRDESSKRNDMNQVVLLLFWRKEEGGKDE